jgi:hypothetical protein
MEEIIINKSIRYCKVCNLSNEVNKFQKNKRICIKCNSKKCNLKLGNEYFRKYMFDHYIPRCNKVGRPKKVVEIITSNN